MLRRLLVLVTVAGCALPAAAGLARASAPAGPDPVTALAAYAHPRSITVRWTNPASGFAHVVVRYARGATPPAGPHAGHGVRLARPKATSAQLTGLAADTRYSVAVWTVDRHHRHSTAAVTRFTTETARLPTVRYIGRVVDDTGAPLVGARIDAQTSDLTGRDVAAASGPDGRFVLSLTPGEWYVDVDGSYATGGDSDATGYLGPVDSVELAAPGPVDAGDITLYPGAAISGRVTDSAGDPLAGVTPSVIPVVPYVEADGFFTFYSFVNQNPITTAADGTFTLRGVWTGSAVQVCFDTTAAPVTGGSADATGYVDTCTSKSTELSDRQIVTLPDTALDAASGGSLLGRVSAPDGTGASAWVELDRKRYGPQAWVATRPDGSFRVDGLGAGSYRVCASSTGSATTATGYAPHCAKRRVSVRSGKLAKRNVTLRVGAAVTGTVTGPGGIPVVGAAVDVPGSGGLALTDAKGHYRVVGLTGGRHRACFDTSWSTATRPATGVASGCYRHRNPFTVRAGSVRTGIDVRLHLGGAVAGRVTDTAGRPLADVTVFAESATYGEAYATSDAHGHYVVRGVRDGTYRICFDVFNDDDTELGRCHPGRVTIHAGRTVRGVDGTLPATGSIAVTVQDSSGMPVAGADAVAVSSCSYCDRLRLFNPRKRVRVVASDVSDGDGTVLLDGLRPGHYAVCIFGYFGTTTAGSPATGYADGCSSASFDLAVTKGAPAPVTLTLQPAGAVSGTVTDRAGHPLSHVRVRVSGAAAEDYPNDFGPSGPSEYSYTDDRGRYTVRSVQPGEQTVCFRGAHARPHNDTGGYFDQCFGGAPGTRSGGTAVTVTANATNTADIALTSAAAVVGRVTDTRGRAVRDAIVVAFRTTGRVELGQTFVRSDGRYSVLRLPAGGVVVCVVPLARYQARCYRRVVWRNVYEYPPISKATPVPTRPGRATRIDLRLRTVESPLARERLPVRWLRHG